LNTTDQTLHVDVYVIVTGINNWNSAALGIAAAMCISTGLFFIVVILVVIASRPYDATGGNVFNRDFAGGMRISNSFCNRFKNWFSMMCFGVPAYLISWGFFINLITTAKSE
jgi:ABC-type Fe3+ transport system permease subunit